MFIVVDTSSLILQPELLVDSYPLDTLVVPFIAINELDKLKVGSSPTSVSARRALSLLDEMKDNTPEEDKHKEVEGIPQADFPPLSYIRPNGGSIVITQKSAIPHEINAMNNGHNGNDLFIVALAYEIKKQGAPVAVLTQDRSMSILAELVGVDSLRHTAVPRGIGEGVMTLKNIPGSVQSMYADGAFHHKDNTAPINTGVIVKDGNTQALGIVGHGNTIKRVKEKINPQGLEPKDSHQTIAIDLMTGGHNGDCKEEFLGALSGRSGSGKTTLAIAVGLMGVQRGTYDRVMVFRPAEPVGKDVGFLPGSIEEKMEPWAAAISDVLRDLNMKDTIHQYNDYGDKKVFPIDEVISVENINFVRGRTFTNTFVIVDEAQNLTVTELRTLASRCGMGSAFVCTFDPSQVDNAYLRNGRAEGVEEFLSSVLGHPSAFHVKLNTPVRGGVSALID